MTDEQARFRYAPDKWSLKEVLGHIADTERVMSYRMLRIARGDTDAAARLRPGRFYVENAASRLFRRAAAGRLRGGSFRDDQP